MLGTLHYHCLQYTYLHVWLDSTRMEHGAQLDICYDSAIAARHTLSDLFSPLYVRGQHFDILPSCKSVSGNTRTFGGQAIYIWV
jgi:hypothetical protein